MELQTEIDIYLLDDNWKCAYQDENTAIMDYSNQYRYFLEKEKELTGKVKGKVKGKVNGVDLMVYWDISARDQSREIYLLGNYKTTWFRISLNDINENTKMISMNQWGEDSYSEEAAYAIKQTTDAFKEEVEQSKKERLLYLTGIKKNILQFKFRKLF